MRSRIESFLNRQESVRYPTLGLVLIIIIVGWFTPSFGQSQANPDVGQQDGVDEIPIVFRLSKPFFDAVVGKQQIKADIPFSGRVLGLNCTAVIQGVAQPTIDIQGHGQSAIIRVRASGTGGATGNCYRGPVAVISPMWGPFTTRTDIQFDGRRFTHQCTCACIDLDGCLQQIRGRRNRRCGRALGRSLMPIGRKLMPRAVAQAKPLAERHVRDYVYQEAEKAITLLNQRSPVEDTIHRIFPETESWAIQLSGQPDFIQVSYGPTEAPQPELADIDDAVDVPHVEIWLKSTAEEAQALARLSNLPLANELIEKYLETNMPELFELGDQRAVTAVESWIRIQVGESGSNGKSESGGE